MTKKNPLNLARLETSLVELKIYKKPDDKLVPKHPSIDDLDYKTSIYFASLEDLIYTTKLPDDKLLDYVFAMSSGDTLLGYYTKQAIAQQPATSLTVVNFTRLRPSELNLVKDFTKQSLKVIADELDVSLEELLAYQPEEQTNYAN